MRFIAPSTATKSPQRRLQEGQAIVLIALLMLVLFAMLGLAIDSGRAYVDRRDLQAAVDAAALASGDWYENFSDLNGSTGYGALPHGIKIFETDLHLYSGSTSNNCRPSCPNYVGPLSNLQQNTYDVAYPNMTLTVEATNTQYNGYQFVFSAVHQLPLAFMQIFGGPTTATITATATAIVGNQRQSPALLTLSTANCATNLSGAGRLTVLGDTYSNGTVCTGLGLREAGNCYGAAGSQCSSASYWCYNSMPGFIPYDPNGPPPPPHPPGACAFGDVVGGPVVPAPSLPDPGYLAPSVPFYSGSGVMISHGSYTELTPGAYSGFFLSGPGCYFLDAGVYTWNGNYVSHGGMVSNELKAPDESLWSAAGSPTQTGGNTFWGAGGCAGSFSVASASVPGGQGMSHQGGLGNWGIEVTSVRYDRFRDNTISGNACLAAPGCMRESAPSACHSASTIDLSNQGLTVNINVNSPGAQYYNVYINPQGCVGDVGYIGGSRSDFSFVNTFAAPVAGATLTGALAPGGWACAAPGVTLCNINYNNLLPATTHACSTWARANKNCWTPEDETPPTCFANCPPQPAVPQENAPFELQYFPNTGGDTANENYCQAALTSGGDPAQPCAAAKITPGAVQFYFPVGSCVDQNAGGYTHVFSGEQYNWLVIYQQAGPLPIPPNVATCSPNRMNGNALTQYIGTIYSPSADWQIQGADKSPLSGQVICSTATVTGGGQAGIDYNPNYAPAPPAARLIN
jgi:Putative Flp pilus-assembly TadE/G-like